MEKVRKHWRFQPIFRFISKMVQYTAIGSYNERQIGTRMRTVE